MTLSSNSTVCRLLIYCFLFSPKVKQGEGSRTHFDTGRENRGPSFSPSHPSHNTIAVTEYRAVELSGNCRRTLIPSRQQLIIHLPIEELMQNNAVKTNVERILIVKKQPSNASNVRWFLAGNTSGRAQGDAAAKMLAGKKFSF